jgi:hypothetical protein
MFYKCGEFSKDDYGSERVVLSMIIRRERKRGMI